MLRARSATWRRGLAAVSAVAAVTAGAQPTGWVVADAVLPAALGAAVVLFAFRTKPQTLAIAAAAAAVAAVGSAAHPLALLTVGFAVATAFTARRGPAATALAGLGLVQVALRLDLPAPLPHGTSALVAAALVVPVCVSGYRRMRRGDRRWVRRGAFVLTAASALGVMLGVLAVAEARAGLERGVDRATAGLAAARRADQSVAADALAESGRNFAGAQDTLSAWWVRPALSAPVVAQHVRVLQAVASSGVELASAGADVAEAANLDAVTIVDGRVPLDTIRALDAPLARAGATISSARTSLVAGRSGWLWPSVGRRLDTQLARLADAETTAARTSDAVGLLPRLFGEGGSRRWFLAVQTPVEGRATGGFMGNWGELTATDGKVALTRFGRVRELNEGGNSATKTISGPPDYLARYHRFAPEVTWQNVNLSPDFPTVARVIGDLYPQSGGQPVDGAIAIDPTGLAALLRITGPIEVAGWPEPLTADNVETTLLYEQYIRFPNEDRPELLGDLAEAVFRRLTSTSLPPAHELLKTLGPAVAGRHLQIASLRAPEAAVLRRLDVDGAFPAVAGDFFSVTTQNGSGNKIEWFLRRSIDYSTKLAPDGRLTATAKVTLHNTAPAAGLPPYLIGAAADIADGTSRLYVTLYSPWALTGVRVDGRASTLGSERELGRWAYATFVAIPAGGSATIEIDLEGVVAPAWRGDAYQLVVHHQPTVAPDDVRLTVNGRARHRSLTADAVVVPVRGR